MKRMAIIALLTCLLLPAMSTLAFTSPLVSPVTSPLPVMPQKPEGLENCPCYAIEHSFGISWATCNAFAVEQQQLDIHWKYITGCYTGAYTGPACDGMLDWSLVTPTPAPTSTPPITTATPRPTTTPTPAAEWLMDALWMDRCLMWTDGYRVTRVECP